MTQSIDIILKCYNFPGLTTGDKQSVFVGVQRKKEVVDAVPGDSEQAVFSIPVQVKAGKDHRPDFLGPNVHGRPGDRFLYLVWFENNGTQASFSRAKIKLNHLAWADLKGSVEAELSMTDAYGEPVCASLKEDVIRWQGSREG